MGNIGNVSAATNEVNDLRLFLGNFEIQVI